MEKKSKKEKFNEFMERNAEWIVPTAGVLAIAGLYVVAVVTTTKKVNSAAMIWDKWAEEENRWIGEQNAAGKEVYMLVDGTYMTVPTGTETEWIRDR
jgi:hypothetical protein